MFWSALLLLPLNGQPEASSKKLNQLAIFWPHATNAALTYNKVHFNGSLYLKHWLPKYKYSKREGKRNNLDLRFEPFSPSPYNWRRFYELKLFLFMRKRIAGILSAYYHTTVYALWNFSWIKMHEWTKVLSWFNLRVKTLDRDFEISEALSSSWFQSPPPSDACLAAFGGHSPGSVPILEMTSWNQ